MSERNPRLYQFICHLPPLPPLLFLAVCSCLTPGQEAALANYRAAFGLKAKDYWEPSQLFNADDKERRLIEELKARCEAAGHLADEDHRAFCSDLTMLRYLRARDHNLGAWCLLTITFSSHVRQRMHQQYEIFCVHKVYWLWDGLVCAPVHARSRL